MNGTTLSATGPWPIKPGLKLIPESRLDKRSDREILSSLQEYHPVTTERNVWAYWHSGISSSPPWVQRTVVNWIRRLPPTWTVRILDKIPGSPLHFHRYVTPTLLPNALNNNTMTGPHVGPHSADLLRLPLIFLHGGVWMDAGTILFRNLDDICWSELEDPKSPYEFSGFTLDSGGPAGKVFNNSFIAARKGNPFVKRWHDIFLEVWRGKTESKGAHAHPLLIDMPPMGTQEDIQSRNKTKKSKPQREVVESQAQLQQPKCQPPEPVSPGTLTREDLSDYGTQFLCFTRLCNLEDPSDGFNGPEYLNNHALLFNAMDESHLGRNLTDWEGMLEYEYLATKKIPENEQEGTLDPRYLEAEKFADSMVRDSCMLKVPHGLPNMPVKGLGSMWELPGNEDADWAEGTFAAYLRYASVFLEQTRAMEPVKFGPSWGKIMRVGVSEAANDGTNSTNGSCD